LKCDTAHTGEKMNRTQPKKMWKEWKEKRKQRNKTQTTNKKQHESAKRLQNATMRQLNRTNETRIRTMQLRFTLDIQLWHLIQSPASNNHVKRRPDGDGKYFNRVVYPGTFFLFDLFVNVRLVSL
jgi:hypothetical protein